ncbi:MAG: hypothetical protein HY056_11620 [Proteobacteria bacterium]|nr:hypothetical protein [Pseudomonadota bacterium]
MWKRKSTAAPAPPAPPPARPLRDALRQVRIEAAERSGVVVELRDAEAARLEALNEALDPIFAEVPAEVDLFDRGISRGDPVRLWIDVIAHVSLARDKRTYRFLQETRHGRSLLAESVEIGEIVDAVTRYMAWRMIERERALGDPQSSAAAPPVYDHMFLWRRRWQSARVFVYGLVIGLAALALATWVMVARL